MAPEAATRWQRRRLFWYSHLLPRHATQILRQWREGHWGYTGWSHAHDAPLWLPSRRRVPDL